MRKMMQIEKKTVFAAGSEFEYALMGTKNPAIVLINGAGGPIEAWLKVWGKLGRDNVVFAYNRLGIGKSSKPKEPQTGGVMVRDLKSILFSLKIEPPYLIVGHSLGGLVAHLFALTYPDDVCGIIFLESSTVQDVLANPKKAKGKGQNAFSEVGHVRATVTEIQAFSVFPDIPISVIAGGKPAFAWFMPKSIKEERMKHQKELLKLSRQGSVVIAKNSGHFPQLTEPDLVIQEIKRLLFDLDNVK